MSAARTAAELEALYWQMLELYKSKKFQELADMAAPLVAKYPTVYSYHTQLGLAHLGLLQFESAVELFRSALKIQPDNEAAILGLGQGLRRLGRNGEALPFLVESYYLKPTMLSGTEVLRAAFDSPEEDRELIETIFKNQYREFFARRPEDSVVMSPYVDAIVWCSANGIELKELYAGGEISLTDQRGLLLPPYNAAPVRFAEIPDGVAIPGFDWVISPSGEVLDGTGLLVLNDWGNQMIGGEMSLPYAADPPRRRVLHASSKQETYIDQDVLFLSAPRVNHFGHWILDYLPRLIGRRPHQKVFTQADLTRAQRETLERFGLRAEDLVEGEVGHRYRFRSITAAVQLDSSNVSPSAARFVYRALATKQAPAPGSTSGRYYLERSQTHRGRSVANSDDFKGLLDEFDFKVVRRPEVTVADQDRIFSDASIILAPFGSDLVTWYQARPRTDVVVLEFRNLEEVYQGLDQIAPRYCAILDMKLHVIHCDVARREGKIPYHGDLRVDCDALRLKLTEIIADRASKGPG